MMMMTMTVTNNPTNVDKDAVLLRNDYEDDSNRQRTWLLQQK